MRARPLGLGALLLAAAVVVPAASGLASDTPSSDGQPSAVSATIRTPVPELTWVPCTDVPEVVADQPFLCATATVPLDHADPVGRTIDIALAKYPASHPDTKIGTLFINPGGPGGSGVDAAYAAGAFLDQGLDGRFDIVGFDPRGVARSSPMRCFDTADEQQTFADGVLAFPYRKAMRKPFFTMATTLSGICAERSSRIIDHMSTTDVVRDLDLLRRAVGDRKLTYLGLSYGTFLGQVYANMFPDRFRAIAIDGVVDPVQYTDGRQIDADEYATQEVMDEFLRLCDGAASVNPTSCPLSRGEGGSRARWAELQRLLKRAPIMVDGEAVTYSEVIAALLNGLYHPRNWSEMAAGLDGLLAVASGELGPSAVSPAAQSFVASSPRYDNTRFEAFFGNHCSDIEYPSAFRDWKRRGVDATNASPFGTSWWWEFSPCASWPVDDDRYLGPWTPATDRPILVVGSRFDPATPLAAARTVSRLIDQDRLVTYEGYGHVAWGLDRCATDIVHRYLLSGELPTKAESTCPAPANPFLAVQPTSRTRTAIESVMEGSWPRL